MQKEKQLRSYCKKSLSSREVVARDLPHPMMLSLLNRKQQPYFMRKAEDPGTLRAARCTPPTSGMTTYFKGVGPGLRPSGAPLRSGFTLIELLVVVLIIGILAAVALPQYRKAVEKSKATQAITMLKTVYDTAKAYQLANGQWPENFDELSVDIPWTSHTSLIPIGFNRTPLSNEDWAIHIYNANNTNTGITLMRISGKYAGAFFAMRASSTYASMPLEQLLCGEESTVFNQTAGEYCVKILKGKQVPNISSGTQYYAIF